MISYCGINCEKCEALIATRTDNNLLRAKVADEISVFTGIQCTADEINCSGCRSDGEKSPYCQKICKARKCAIKRNLVHCGQCEQYPCSELKKIFSFAPQAKETLDRLYENQKKEDRLISMKPIEKIAIIGAGAIGASYASMFYNMSMDSVSFIAGEERCHRLRQDGILVNGMRYDIPAYLPGHIPAPYDLVIVAVKHHQLEMATRDLQRGVGDETIILSFMNGIESEETIASVYGMEKVLFSIVLGIDAVRAENSTMYSNQGRVFFGEARNDVVTIRVKRVKDLFERAGINYVIPDNMIRTMWWKFMINVGINQASAALRATYKRFQTFGEARSLMDSAMREVMLLAQAQGIDLNEGDIENWHDVLSKLSPDGKTSMLQDVEAGRKTEVEMFAGKVIELGKCLNIPTPVNEEFFQEILKIEDR